MVRLWPFATPIYDTPGLNGIWGESGTVQSIIYNGKKAFSTNPLVTLFTNHLDAKSLIYFYRLSVWVEGTQRRKTKKGKPFNYSSDSIIVPEKINFKARIKISKGEYLEQWRDLKDRIKQRSPDWYEKIKDIHMPPKHPVFEAVR